MADTKRYQVVAACAILPVTPPGGTTTVQTLYRGSVIEGDPEDIRVKHNAESGYIVEIDAKATPGVDGSGTPLVDDKPTVGDGNPGDPTTTNDPGVVNQAAHDTAGEVTAKRETAKAKLPEDGSAPDGRASKDVFVEYLAARGYSYDELVKQDKAELTELAKQQS